jgi:ligand-binding sensor domain-containing protein/signal transduction histidine kinase
MLRAPFVNATIISCFLPGDSEYTVAVILARMTLLRGIFLSVWIACVIFRPGWVQASPEGTMVPQDLTMRTWNKQQGLPDDSVTAVLQSHDGYLWVGTSSGLARFDGTKFTLMSPQNWKTNSPLCVTALCEDSKGKLWIGTQDNGLLCYDDGVVRWVMLHMFDSQTVNSIAEDAQGTLWIGTPSGLARLQGEKVSRFTTADGLPNDFVSNVHVARSGVVWITTRSGMCQFTNNQLVRVAFQTDSAGRNPESLGVYEDRSGKHWAFGDTYLVNLDDNKYLNHFGGGDAASTRIWSLCEGQNGELWIGTSGKGLFCFNGKFVPVTIHNGELTSDVRAICEDRQGNLWLGTYGDGLVRLQRRNARVLDANAGLPNRPPVCLAVSPQGHAWIGFDRAGLYESAARNFEPLLNNAMPGLQNLVSTICATPDSSLWVGTPGAGLFLIAKQKHLHLTTADGLSDNNILSSGMDSDGTLWVGTAARLDRISNGVISSFGVEEGLPDEPVTALVARNAGGMWLGFNNGAVYRENLGQFHRVSTPSSVQSKPIRALCEDSLGRLWIGAENGRIGCVIDGRFMPVDLLSGAADTSILGIIATADGDVWFGTDRSVYSLAQKELAAWTPSQPPPKPQRIFRADSVPNVATAYGWPRAIQSSDGTLWFAMDSGLVTVDLAAPAADTAPPPVLIENISVNGQPLAGKLPTTPLRISETNLEIRFTAIDLSAPEKIRFRHRLDGYESDWVVGNEPKAQYGLLPYGPYTFRAQAGNGDQTWFDNGASFSFIIPTPIWRTNWALAGYVIMGLLLVGGVVRLILARRYRRRLAALASQRAMERERMRIARDMHDEIGSKLTKISFMTERAKIELDGHEPVARKLDAIAGTSRDLLQTLDEIVWAVNPHNDTLEHLAAYLGQYATEYLQNTAVECELHIPRGLPHHPLSAEARHNLFLAFEESLNNALKHGHPTRIRVDMQIAPRRFEIIIEDNGRGFESSTDALASGAEANNSGLNGNGLQNMRQRLAILDGQCTIVSRPGHGTTVRLRVPLAREIAAKPNGAIQ